MKTDMEYFAERAEEERAAADDAQNRNAKQSHLELADAYDELSAALERAHAPTL